eukprot:UN04688
MLMLRNCTQALKLVEDKDKEIERISDLYKKCIRDYENAMMLVAQREHWQKQTEGKYQDLVQHMTLERSVPNKYIFHLSNRKAFATKRAYYNSFVTNQGHKLLSKTN